MNSTLKTNLICLVGAVSVVRLYVIIVYFVHKVRTIKLMSHLSECFIYDTMEWILFKGNSCLHRKLLGKFDCGF
jgi:hypothetical protein